MTRTEQGLKKVLVDLGMVGAAEVIKVRRTRAGRNQRCTGAWSWWATDTNGYEVAGSQYTCGEIIKAHRNGLVTQGEDSYFKKTIDLWVEDDPNE